MKKFIALAFLCILAFACSPVMATGFSPGHYQKHAIEKTTLQASPSIVVIVVNAEITAPSNVYVLNSNQNEIFKETKFNLASEINSSTAWREPARNQLNFKNQLFPEPGYQIAERIPVKLSRLPNQSKLTHRLIPYSRDRS